MKNNFFYVFKCEYGNRVKERKFIKDVLHKFDKDYASMVGIIVNNNPYCLEFSIAINIMKDPIKFENWLKKKYPEKYRHHNIFLKELICNNNFITFIDDDMVDIALLPEPNGIFHYPEQELLESKFPQYKCLKQNESKVFISHSSKDKKKIVNPIYSYLQAENIGTWIDSYEIDYGDNIYLKVNEGIDNSDIGLFILTDNFFDSKSGWPVTEFSTFFMEAMKNNKKILFVNAGVSPQNMHTIMKSYKYIVWSGFESLPEIGNAIKRVFNSQKI